MKDLPTLDIDFYSDEVIADPFPVYEKMRDMGPVVYLSRHDVYALPRYAETSEVLRQPHRFISSKGVSLIPEVNEILIGSTLNSDPPQHDLTRSVTSEPLWPGALHVVEDRIRDAADGLVDTLAKRRTFDAVKDFAQFLPVTIVAELVGLPDGGRENMLKWASATFNLFGSMNERSRAAFDDLKELRDFLDEYGRPEKLKPGGWAKRIFEIGPERGLSYATCAQIMRDYINPSLDSTISTAGQMIKLFAENPDQWDKLRAEPLLLTNAIEEAVRLSAPLRAMSRYVVEDSVIAGYAIPADSRVLVMFASANRDPRKWDDPDRFDVTRDVHDHVGFGQGVHMCLGMHLARLELTALFEALLRRVKRFELTEEPKVAFNNSIRAFSYMPTRIELLDEIADIPQIWTSNAEDDWIDVTVSRRTPAATDILALELTSATRAPLPPFGPGDHIDVQIQSGLIRQYSLAGDPGLEGPYRLGVLLDPDSRGGSARVHGDFAVGKTVRIGRPRANFPLNMEADHSILFAGGIGITPMLSMAYALDRAGKSFELHYSGRSADRLAFTDELARFGDRVRYHLDDGPRAQMLDVGEVLASPTARTHVYCCGPNGFMDFVIHAAEKRGWATENLHLERFGAEVNTDGAPFTVVAAKSGKTFEVAPGERISEKLIENGIEVAMSCQSGVCGTCVTKVLDGMPDHRDMVLTDLEKASNRQITVCCSRSKTKKLVLDI
ncbi:MAG: cytochrome P450/oxidoreductase [Maritimibacter sp.]|nr:cytochrome P450/oxidoreductase [Maritimibacter sp.]